MKAETKSTLNYVGWSFLFFLAAGFIFGPKYLNLTPLAILLLSIGGAALCGLKGLLDEVWMSRLFGIPAEAERQSIESLMSDHNVTISNDPLVIADLIDKVLKAEPQLGKLDPRKRETSNVFYARIFENHNVMVGKPKIIKKILRETLRA